MRILIWDLTIIYKLTGIQFLILLWVKKSTKKGVKAGNYILFKLSNEFSITLNIETLN